MLKSNGPRVERILRNTKNNFFQWTEFVINLNSYVFCYLSSCLLILGKAYQNHMHAT